MGTDSAEVRQLVRDLEKIAEAGRIASASRETSAAFMAELALREHYSRMVTRRHS